MKVMRNCLVIHGKRGGYDLSLSVVVGTDFK